MTDFKQNSSGLWVPDTATDLRQFTLYCDESGNTGGNYLDPEQPYYVLAGWMIPDDRVTDVSLTVESFRQK